MLTVTGLILRKSGRPLLGNVDLQATGGEFIAVVGANGAGKSTLLAALAGLQPADGGTVTLDGRPLSRHTPTALAKRRAYLPQNPRCDWPLPVERLVALGLTPRLPTFGGLPAGDRARVDQALAAMDLADKRDQAATTLSGGELMRAMLARALVGEPGLLIADEPVSGLDPRHGLETMRRLRAVADGGTLVIAALHDLTLAARHATRLLALADGQVVADGPPATTLTPALVQRVFNVGAAVLPGSRGPIVDVHAPL